LNKGVSRNWLVSFVGKERRGIFREMSDYNLAQFFKAVKEEACK